MLAKGILFKRNGKTDMDSDILLEPYRTKMRCESCDREELWIGCYLNMRFDCLRCRAKNAFVGYDVLEYGEA